MNAETQRSQRVPQPLSHALRLCVLPVVACAVYCGAALADGALSAAEHVARANQALAGGDHEKALSGYREADVLLPDAPELAYNQGVAYYRMRDFAQAREMFSRALTTRDLAMEARAKFNLGNCRYAQALEKLSDLQEAIDELRTAIEYYRDVLDLTPGDLDARANIETAQLLIKDLLDKLKKQQEEQQQDPTSQPSEDQKSDERQEGEKSEQEQQEQEGKQQQDQQQSGEQEQQEQTQEQEQQAAAEERQLTEEEARRLLQAVRDKERQRSDERTRRARLGRPKVDKDW